MNISFDQTRPCEPPTTPISEKTMAETERLFYEYAKIHGVDNVFVRECDGFNEIVVRTDGGVKTYRVSEDE